jgi:hypothetical protein
VRKDEMDIQATDEYKALEIYLQKAQVRLKYRSYK